MKKREVMQEDMSEMVFSSVPTTENVPWKSLQGIKRKGRSRRERPKDVRRLNLGNWIRVARDR